MPLSDDDRKMLQESQERNSRRVNVICSDRGLNRGYWCRKVESLIDAIRRLRKIRQGE